MAESLHCSPEDTIPLLVGYTPIKHKKFKELALKNFKNKVQPYCLQFKKILS